MKKISHKMISFEINTVQMKIANDCIKIEWYQTSQTSLNGLFNASKNDIIKNINLNYANIGLILSQ